jgi:hypothetical protein
VCRMTSNMGYLYGEGTKFDFFKDFFGFFEALMVKKPTNFSIQTVKFVFKRSNLNLNKSITRRYVTTASRPQWQPLVRGDNAWAIALRTVPTRALPSAPAGLLR